MTQFRTLIWLARKCNPIGPGIRTAWCRSQNRFRLKLDRFFHLLPNPFGDLLSPYLQTMGDSLFSVVSKFYDSYMSTTPKKLKIIDAYLLYILLTGIIQFVYCCLVGTFPFNSFLSGFISCVGSFILGGKYFHNWQIDLKSFFCVR